MNEADKNSSANAIRDAIRQKHERKTEVVSDINALEASLLADIDIFDLDAAERRARHGPSADAEMTDHQLEFPEIVSTPIAYVPKVVVAEVPLQAPMPEPQIGSLLSGLRQQADQHRRQEKVLSTERTASNHLIDRALKFIFFYLHDLVQQLNTLKPEIPRTYLLADNLQLANLVWQEGFTDYRTQSQSAGAMMELVTFSYQLAANKPLVVERDGPVVERFRSTLFDYGLKYSCKEFKSERLYVERAEFQISSQLSVSIRWRADFERGVLVFETRNFERLGVSLFNVKPGAVDLALLEELGKLVLGQNSCFRELAKR